MGRGKFGDGGQERPIVSVSRCLVWIGHLNEWNIFSKLLIIKIIIQNIYNVFLFSPQILIKWN